jgi:hypothetical protein
MPKRINDLLEVTSLASSDLLVAQTSQGTKKIQFGNLMPVNSHNAIFRGKNLGTVNIDNIDAFMTAHGVSAGTFTDLYLGDYVTASYNGSNITFRVAGFDTHLRQGDTGSGITRHHIEIVPDQSLATAKMNSTNTTGKSANPENTSNLAAYAGSDMHNLVIPTINTNLEAIFGGHLFSYRELLTNTMDPNGTSAGSTLKGVSSNRAWYDVKAVLMSEVEVYGSNIWSSSAYDAGTAIHQIPLFSIEPRFINLRYWYWLRDVASSANFCVSHGGGYARNTHAAYSTSVRPRFLLG